MHRRLISTLSTKLSLQPTRLFHTTPRGTKRKNQSSITKQVFQVVLSLAVGTLAGFSIKTYYSTPPSVADNSPNYIGNIAASIRIHLKSGLPSKEFMMLENEKITCALTEAYKPYNKEKNRYTDILPCDKSRVKLSPIAGVTGSDYINANYIEGDGSARAYIATQGPLMNTRGDFWRMIWENNSTSVVMLGKEIENGRLKMNRYWPEKSESPLRLKDLQVELVDTVLHKQLGITVRKLRLTNLSSKEVRSVVHYHYQGWPDHGVPTTAAPIRQLIHMIEQDRVQTKSSSPMVVHCSAGVGRTGTFITIHSSVSRLNQLHSNPSATILNENFSLYDTVLKLRQQRPGMVQQESQYRFCYEAIAEEADQLGGTPTSPVNS